MMHTSSVRFGVWMFILAALVAGMFGTTQLDMVRAAQGCGTAPTPRLTVGQTARVTVSTGIGNRLRSTAATTGTILGVMPDGEVFTVVSGPQCAENFYWWQVRRWDGQMGWTAEGITAEYWVEPWPTTGAKVAVGSVKPDPNLGRIAFVRTDPANNQQLFVMAADGSTPVNLTPTTPVFADQVDWTKDGKALAFTVGSNNAQGELVMLDMTAATPPAFAPITALTSKISAVDWASDGQRIVFASDKGSPGIFDIYVRAATGITNLTNTPAVNDSQPTWSPDGQRIAFVSDRDGNPEIYVMNADGTNPVRLTNDPGDDTTPVWSASGIRLAFISERDGNPEIYTMNADGSGPVRMTNTPGKDTNPTWSPDDKRIAYFSETAANSGAFELFSVRSDATDRMQYTIDGSSVAGLSWAPDSNWLVFASYRSGNFDIYAIRSSGAGLINLTNTPTNETNPVWSPPAPGTPLIQGTPAGTANPAEQDLLLIYDASVPVFTLQNVSGKALNLTPLSFTGAGVTVPATIWDTQFLASPLDNFMNRGCLQLWRFGLPDQAAPAECGTARQGWVSEQTNVFFWTQGSFTVSYNGVSVATCDSAAGRCSVNLP